MRFFEASLVDVRDSEEFFLSFFLIIIPGRIPCPDEGGGRG